MPDGFSQDTTIPLLPTSSDAVSQRDADVSGDESRPRSEKAKMRFFDNLTKWDRSKVYRYGILLVLSLSGDGWSVRYHRIQSAKSHQLSSAY